ncbi:hypothetical protein [Bradyrhizobium sp. BR 1432]|uniref:hypothetical protein n=1 Tax=Bradyrhizobium sp. BR 1432 TaxID=3447966 RepID=UPI003EE7926C
MAVKTAEPVAVEHGDLRHDLNSASANAQQAADIIDPSVATGGDAGRGNSRRAAQSAAIASTQPAKAAFETGGADREPVFHFDSAAAPSTVIARVELKELNDPLDLRVPPGQPEDLEMIIKMVLNAPGEQAANHGNNGPHHAIGPAPHDLLI